MDWHAAWIWHPETGNDDNFYLYARANVMLGSAAPNACAYVTAGSLYKLYINGHYVGRGPNPADPSYYYYDVHEVGALLHPGINTVALVCYAYGPESQGILGQNWGRGALLFELRDQRDGVPLLVSNADWKVIQAPPWDQSAPINCTLYADYKEIYDSRREIDGWMERSFDDSDWLTPAVLGTPPIEPYTRLIEREIPFLGGECVFPVNVHSESASVTYAWREDEEIYHEHRLIPGSPWYMSDKYVEVYKTHADFSPSLLLDFGRDVTGYPEIVIQDSGGGIIDVLYGESLQLVRVDRFILKGGRQTLRPFNRRTFRYMKLLFQETPRRIEIDRINMAMDTYPVAYTGAFTCSDVLLNRIWEVGRTTIHLSMLDHFVDCPWRERTIYGGDVYNENLIAHYAFGDPRLNRKTLRQMFAIQYPEGALPPYGPYRGCDGFYPSWTAFFGLAFLDHYALTGDRAFLDELWPAFSRLLDWAMHELDANDPHLIGRPAKGRKFSEWNTSPKSVFGAWDNFPFLVLLRRSAELARTLGKSREAHRYAAAARRMAATLRNTMIDADGFAVPYPHDAAAQPRTQSDSAYLLWSGLLEAAEGSALAAKLTAPELKPIDTPFFALLLAEGLFAYGDAARALAFIRSYYGALLDRGATTFWEHFSLQWPAGVVTPSSLCHGWSAGPTYSLPAHVLGIQPLEPGFATVLFEPQLGDLTWARGTVPTPHGPAGMVWKLAGKALSMDVTVPDGCTGIVVLPRQCMPRGLTVDGLPTTATRQRGRNRITLAAGTHRLVCRLARTQAAHA